LEKRAKQDSGYFNSAATYSKGGVMYDVFLLLGTPQNPAIKSPSSWLSILTQLKKLPFYEPLYITIFTAKFNNGRSMRFDLQSSKDLDGMAQTAAETISKKGYVVISSHPDSESSPAFFLCCAPQHMPNDVELRFDPFFLFTSSHEFSQKCTEQLQSLISTIARKIESKLSVHQIRPFEIQNVIGGTDSLRDAPFGIFKPGPKHDSEPAISILRGDWQHIATLN